MNFMIFLQKEEIFIEVFVFMLYKFLLNVYFSHNSYSLNYRLLYIYLFDDLYMISDWKVIYDIKNNIPIINGIVI